MIAFDHRDGAARPEYAAKTAQSALRIGEMLQQEANKDVIEGGAAEGQMENVGHAERDVAAAGGFDAGSGLLERRGGDVRRQEVRARAGGGEKRRLRARAAAAFENPSARGISRVAVEQVSE